MKVKQEIQELFPTPLWVVDLPPADAVAFNAKLKADIEAIIAPRPKVPSGSNWQTPQDLHTRPAFADFTMLVEKVARSVAQNLQVEQYPLMITGCWANINPPGSYHPTHNHPNNYLSGVYYVTAAETGSHLLFQDPRPGLILPPTAKLGRLTANAAITQAILRGAWGTGHPLSLRGRYTPTHERHHAPQGSGAGTATLSATTPPWS